MTGREAEGETEMKYLRCETAKLQNIKDALQAAGYETDFAIENNTTTGLQQVGDYNVSGESAIICVPDDFNHPDGNE